MVLVERSRQSLAASDIPAAAAYVVTPSSSGGAYAVCLLVHGFALPGSVYTDVAENIGSRNYVVVVPDVVYSATDSVGSESKVIQDWLKRVMVSFAGIPVVLMGHSRGGQACLRALVEWQSPDCASPVNIAGLVLLDPVEGAPSIARFGRLRPFLLAEVDHWPAALLDVPMLVLGAGLGSTGLFPAAPSGHNYEAIWTALAGHCDRFRSSATRGWPQFLIEASRFGHLDLLNDQTCHDGLVAALSNFIVRGSPRGRATFRSFVADTSCDFLDVCTRMPHDDASWSALFSVGDREGVSSSSGTTVRVRRLPNLL